MTSMRQVIFAFVLLPFAAQADPDRRCERSEIKLFIMEVINGSTRSKQRGLELVDLTQPELLEATDEPLKLVCRYVALDVDGELKAVAFTLTESSTGGTLVAMETVQSYNRKKLLRNP